MTEYHQYIATAQAMTSRPRSDDQSNVPTSPEVDTAEEATDHILASASAAAPSPTSDDFVVEKVDPVIIEKLSKGVIQMLQPDLAKSRTMLEELTENQRILIETIQQENKKFKDCQAFKDVTETMDKAKLYHQKLLNIKKEMYFLHEKSAKLKKRALRLQQQKNKEILEREQIRERELEHERALIATLAKPPSKLPDGTKKT